MTDAVTFQNELCEVMLMTAQDKPYLQAKDPDAIPRFREILVTRYDAAHQTFHYCEAPAIEITIRHPELLNYAGGDRLSEDRWVYRLRPKTIAALTDEVVFQEIMETVILPIERNRYGELVGREHQADTSFYHHQLEQVS